MGSPAHVKPGIRSKSRLKPGEDIATLPDSLAPEELIDAQLTKLGATGTVTAHWFEKKKPHIYRAVCSCLAHGYPIRQIAFLFKMSAGTVCAIAERECDKLPPAKEAILTKARVAARLAVERVTDEIPNMSGRDASIAFGILSDKMLLLAGEANTIVGKQKEVPTHEDFNAMIASLPAANVSEVRADSQIPPSRSGAARALPPPIVDATPAPLTVSQTVPQQ